MTSRERGDERLRSAFSAPAEAARSTGGCPTDEEIWSASRGDLPTARREELLAHSATCDACAESWRMAAALSSEAGSALAESGRVLSWPRRLLDRRGRFALGLAAAAAAIAAIALIAPWKRPAEEFREVGAVSIQSRLEAKEPLPRDRCILRWSAGPEGTLYTVEVAREDLTVIARAEQIETIEYQVPASALGGLPRGATFLWRVEAVLPDATRVSSPVFRAALE